MSATLAPPMTMNDADPRPVRHRHARKEAKLELSAVPALAKKTRVPVIIYVGRRP